MFLYLFNGHLSRAQNRLESFELFSTTSLTGFYANPVSIKDMHSRGGVVYRSYLGDFKDVRVFSAFGSVKIGEDDAGSNLGLMMYSDQNGPFISKNRFYVHYVNHIKLKNDLRLSFGTLSGAVNVQLGGAGASVSAGGWLFSTNIGSMLSARNWFVGASIQQVFDQELKPIRGAIKFPLSYNVNGGMSKQLSIDYLFSLSSHVRYIPNSEVDVVINPILNYHKALFGSQLTFRKFIKANSIPTVAIIGGIESLSYDSIDFDLIFSYNLGLPNGSVPQQNQLELLLQVHF